MSAAKACWTVLLAALLIGCHKVTFVDPHLLVADTYREERVSFYFWGILGAPSLNLQGACSEGIAKIQTASTTTTQLLHFATLGIYSPRVVRFACGVRDVSERQQPAYFVEFSLKGSPASEAMNEPNAMGGNADVAADGGDR